MWPGYVQAGRESLEVLHEAKILHDAGYAVLMSTAAVMG